MAVFLQYFQMKQMNGRNPQAAAANPQMQQMQKFFPILFGLIYLKVPAGAAIYMVVSSAMRIGTQDIMYRTGMLTPIGPAVEREISPGSKPTVKPDAAQKALGSGAGKPSPKNPPTAKDDGTGTNGKQSAATHRTAATKPTPGTKPPTGSKPTANGKSSTGNRSPQNGRSPSGTRSGANGKRPAGDGANGELVPLPKEHPRSRSKRTRKAR
jgi:hypothetical protein